MHIAVTHDNVIERLGGVNGQLTLCGSGLTAESPPHVLAFLRRYGGLVGSLELDCVWNHPRIDGGFPALDLAALDATDGCQCAVVNEAVPGGSEFALGVKEGCPEPDRRWSPPGRGSPRNRIP